MVKVLGARPLLSGGAYAPGSGRFQEKDMFVLMLNVGIMQVDEIILS